MCKFGRTDNFKLILGCFLYHKQIFPIQVIVVFLNKFLKNLLEELWNRRGLFVERVFKLENCGIITDANEKRANIGGSYDR